MWLTSQGQPVIRDDGGWGPRTQAATTAFQGSVPVPATGVGDLPTWNALDAIAPNVNVGFEERQWTEEVGGHTFGMVNAVGNNGSRYSWEIKPNEMKVTAAVNFVGGGPPGAWFGFVRNVWNHFILVDHATNQRLPINFEMTRDTGAGANTVQVSPGTGRANGGQWFLGDTAAASTIPHEFGHLIGLADEYQQHPGDYRTVTGHEPFVGQTTGPAGQTPQAIATALQAAMVARSSANALAAVAGMAQGAFAQQVVQAYAALPAAVVPAVVVAPVQPAIAPDRQPRPRPRRGAPAGPAGRPDRQVQHDRGADLRQRLDHGRPRPSPGSARPRGSPTAPPGVREHPWPDAGRDLGPRAPVTKDRPMEVAA